MKNGKYPAFIYTDKHKEVIEYLINLFKSNGIKCSNIIHNKRTNCYNFQTETRKEFMNLYELFYPKETTKAQKQKRKILPDILLNSTILLWWYIGDGSSSKVSKSYNHRGQISCKHKNDFILNQLKQLFGDQCNYHSYKNGGTYYLGYKGLELLLNYIGKCPLSCYNYKWILREECSETIIEKS